MRNVLYARTKSELTKRLAEYRERGYEVVSDIVHTPHYGNNSQYAVVVELTRERRMAR